MTNPTRQQISALELKQWLTPWDKVHYNSDAMQSKPESSFFLFKMKATELKALTGVYRRSTQGLRARAKDPNVQREHDVERTAIIQEFVQFGYPWCAMNKSKRESFQDLRKPGWLPTAIIVNILAHGDTRNGKTIAPSDQIIVNKGNDSTEILLPEGYEPGTPWQPQTAYPLEVIDGQHRLWAFDVAGTTGGLLSALPRVNKDPPVAGGLI